MVTGFITGPDPGNVPWCHMLTPCVNYINTFVAKPSNFVLVLNKKSHFYHISARKSLAE